MQLSATWIELEGISKKEGDIIQNGHTYQICVIYMS